MAHDPFRQPYVSESSLLKRMTQPWNIFLLNGYIQVFMRPGLLTKEGINAPPTVNPNSDIQVFQLRIETDYVRGCHIHRCRKLSSIQSERYHCEGDSI